MTSVVTSFFQAMGFSSRTSICELDNPAVAQYYGTNRKLMHDRCYFCSCWPCMSDVLFLLDQSALVDPVACGSPLTEFGFPTDNNKKWYEGSKAQIDFALATIRQMDPARIKSQSVKIAFAFYGDDSSYKTVVDFDDWGINIDDLQCKLYGHEAYPCGDNMDEIEFLRKPLCGTGGLKEAIIQSASYEHQSWRKWDPYHPDVKIRTPIAKILALTAGDVFVGKSFENEAELLNFMRPIHDPINDGFDFVFPVGMATGERFGEIEFERTKEEDNQFWRGMNIIGCLNPEACDYTLMASPSGENENGVDPFQFLTKLMDDAFWDKYFCYYRHWNFFCDIQPFERTQFDIARSVRNKRSTKRNGYKPNSCCGHIPYNDQHESCCSPGHVQLLGECSNTVRSGDDAL
ncbi:Oidioi.mRNA.OKI2018_I69.PAR.g8774.t1.cds [Oikopleura dioica]|uniref:Oidioi.mRNA.OKI2018_I69.PAR.g8774.t1.cds n=1 Tax=Oikopleura dioica TaxID=34765 RepID=A0ABN7RNH0_OIKDI|nr:Oidioi.mRNA.OKI2018_I69.PAR.g8774.t1.cds [Oikopleura dioica]